MGADHHHEHRRITDVRRGQSRAAVTATLAMSCVLTACGVEPRVDEVRVSITAPTLDGHRQLGISTESPPHDVGLDSADVTTPREPYRPVASDTAAIASVDRAVTGGAVVTESGSAQVASRLPDPTDVRPPTGPADADDATATTGAGSVLTDDARGDDVPTDRAPSSDVVPTDTAGTASPSVESGGVAASDRLDGAHSDSVDATDDRPATAWVATAELLPHVLVEADRAGVMTAVHQAWSTVIAARRAPDNASLRAAVSASRAGVERTRSLAELADLAARDHWSLADPLTPNVMHVDDLAVAEPGVVDVESGAANTAGAVAGGFVVATVCVVSTDQLWGHPGTALSSPDPTVAEPDTSDAAHRAPDDAVPIDTAATRSAMRWGLERVGDVWVLSDVVVDWVEIIDAAAATRGCSQ